MFGRGKNPNSRNGFKKGRTVTIKERTRMSERNKLLGIKPPSQKGVKQSEETKLKRVQSRRWYKPSEETKKKIGDSNRGTKYDEERRAAYIKYWNSKKGKEPWNKGEEMPQISGKNHPNWLGGKSFEPYTYEFNKKLKAIIKERDHNRCFLCKETHNKILIIHHIDYNKKNCNPENLLTLCNSCHSKTNFNREFWFMYLSKGCQKVYKISLAELCDRLSIINLKSIVLGCNNPIKKEAYEKEAREIMNDIHYLMIRESEFKNIDWGKLVRAIQIDSLINRLIWENETKARLGGKEQNYLLPLTHSLNGMRQRAGNEIIKQIGKGREDLNLDRVNEDLINTFGFDVSGLFDDDRRSKTIHRIKIMNKNRRTV